jgi:hypothetical protein
MDESRAPRPPRAEPEIIPPGAEPRGQARPGAGQRWSYVEIRQGRVYPLRGPSLFALLLALAILGLVGVVVFLLLIGAVLLWLPLAGILLLAFLAGRFLRSPRAR